MCKNICIDFAFGTLAREFVAQIVASQKGRPHPDKQVGSGRSYSKRSLIEFRFNEYGCICYFFLPHGIIC